MYISWRSYVPASESITSSSQSYPLEAIRPNHIRENTQVPLTKDRVMPAYPLYKTVQHLWSFWVWGGVYNIKRETDLGNEK